MSYTKFSKAVTKWLKDNGLPCYGTANDSPEETKARLDAWMRGSKKVLQKSVSNLTIKAKDLKPFRFRL